MIFLLLILGLLFYLFLWPIAKVVWRGYKMQKRWQEATAGMRNAYDEAFRRSQQEQKTPPKKKKIDPNVGEYVAFEDIACNTEIREASETEGNDRVSVESQIEDASWEEIRQ